MLMAVLFTMAMPLCMCTHACTHTHTHKLAYHSAIKKNEILPFAAVWMDLEKIMLSEISQRQILYDSTYMRNQKKKKIQKGMCMPNRNRLTDLGEKKLVMPKGKKKC